VRFVLHSNKSTVDNASTVTIHCSVQSKESMHERAVTKVCKNPEAGKRARRTLPVGKLALLRVPWPLQKVPLKELTREREQGTRFRD
jgi:hypothetical protein